MIYSNISYLTNTSLPDTWAKKSRDLGINIFQEEYEGVYIPDAKFSSHNNGRKLYEFKRYVLVHTYV